jgi:hypothetical protein
MPEEVTKPLQFPNAKSPGCLKSLLMWPVIVAGFGAGVAGALIAAVSAAADQIAPALKGTIGAEAEAALWLSTLLAWLAIATGVDTWTWWLGETMKFTTRLIAFPFAFPFTSLFTVFRHLGAIAVVLAAPFIGLALTEPVVADADLSPAAAIVALACGICGFVVAAIALRAAAWMRGAHDSILGLRPVKVRDLQPGLACVTGKARTAKAGEAAERPVLKISVGENQTLDPFFLDDDTGSILVDPRGARSGKDFAIDLTGNADPQDDHKLEPGDTITVVGMVAPLDAQHGLGAFVIERMSLGNAYASPSSGAPRFFEAGVVFKLVKGADEQAANRIHLGFVKPLFWAVVWVMSSGFIASHAWSWLNEEMRAGRFTADAAGFSGLLLLEKARSGLRDPHPPIRYAATKILVGLGAEAESALGDLRAALRDAHWRVREQAATALGNLGTVAAPAAFELADLALDREQGLLRAPDFDFGRRRAAYAARAALEKIGAPAIDALRQDGNPSHAQLAETMARAMAPAAPPALADPETPEPPPGQAPADPGPTISGRLLFDGQLITVFTDGEPSFWFRNEAIGKEQPAQTRYRDGGFTFIGLPPGKFLVSIGIDANRGNLRGYPGDFHISHTFDVLVAGTEPFDINLGKVIRLTSPEDTNVQLARTPKNLSGPVRLAWEPILPSADYSWNLDGPGRQNGVTKDCELSLDLAPGKYSFRLRAHKDGRFIGQMLVHPDRALAWHYAFEVVE